MKPRSREHLFDNSVNVSVFEFVGAEAGALTRPPLMPSLDAFPAKWRVASSALDWVDENIMTKPAHELNQMPLVPFINLLDVDASFFAHEASEVELTPSLNNPGPATPIVHVF